MNTNNRLLSFFNFIFLLLLSALIIFTPLFFYKKMIVIMIIFIIWFFSTVLLDKNHVITSGRYYVYLVVFLFLDIWRGLMTGVQDDIFLGINKMPTLIWVPIVLFYSNKPNGVIPSLWIICALILISCYFTIIGNIEYPGASRLLAGVNEDYSQDRLLFREMNIGGYDFIYALVFLSFPISLFIKYIPKTRIALLPILLVTFVTIVLGAYMIGILITILYIIITLWNPEKLSIVSLILIAITILLFQGFFLELLYDIGDKFDISALSRHAHELETGTYRDVEREKNRIYIYLNGITNWLQHPVLGDLSGTDIEYKRSGHSEFIGFFEKYGLLALVYVKFFWDYHREIRRRLHSIICKRYFTYFLLVFILFTIVDRFDTFNGIGFAVFFVVPSLLFVLDKYLIREIKHENPLVNK